jgi:hypothetical protein
MPLTGTRDLTGLASAAPLVTDLGTEPWELPRAEVLQVLYEIDDRAMLTIIPPALHPTIPPTAFFTVTRVPASPAGPFILAEVRIGCRAAARPRGFLVRAYCDSDVAAAELRARWGYNVSRADVRLDRQYFRIVGSVAENGVKLLECTLKDPEPISGKDVQYIASMNLARLARDGQELTRLIQVDPDFVFHTADRGSPMLGEFVASAWGLDGVVPVYPVSASYAVCDITLPRLRYLVDPTKPPLQAVETI